MLLTCSASSDLITTVSGVTQGIRGMAGDSTLCAENIGTSRDDPYELPPSSTEGLSETLLYPQDHLSDPTARHDLNPTGTCGTSWPSHTDQPPPSASMPVPRARLSWLSEGPASSRKSSCMHRPRSAAFDPLVREPSLWPLRLILHHDLSTGCVF